jgi:hypothetical protein
MAAPPNQFVFLLHTVLLCFPPRLIISSDTLKADTKMEERGLFGSVWRDWISPFRAPFFASLFDLYHFQLKEKILNSGFLFRFGKGGHSKSTQDASWARFSLHLKILMGSDYIRYRPGGGGQQVCISFLRLTHKVAYLEGCKAVELANGTFGFNGWSSSVNNITVGLCN